MTSTSSTIIDSPTNHNNRNNRNIIYFVCIIHGRKQSIVVHPIADVRAVTKSKLIALDLAKELDETKNTFCELCVSPTNSPGTKSLGCYVTTIVKDIGDRSVGEYFADLLDKLDGIDQMNVTEIDEPTFDVLHKESILKIN
jgi:hypothetical protein